MLIYGRDWNAQLCPNMDSSNKIKRIGLEAVYVKKLLKKLGMIDIWRDVHPHEKYFTFFSHPHSVYTQCTRELII